MHREPAVNGPAVWRLESLPNAYADELLDPTEAEGERTTASLPRQQPWSSAPVSVASCQILTLSFSSSVCPGHRDESYIPPFWVVLSDG